MSQTPLEPDQEALDKWEKMPKGKPSSDALPPAASGMPGWLWATVIILLIVVIIGLIVQ